MKSTFDKIMTGLAGFGAGYQGRGPDFLRAQALEKEQAMLGAERKRERAGELSQERRKAAAQDFREISMALDAGLIDQARTRINDRLRIGSMLPDFDAISSQHVKDLLDAGNIDEAKKFLSFADQAAVSGGYLEPIQRPEPIKLGRDDRLVDPVTNRELVGAATQPVGTLPASIANSIPEQYRAAAQEAYVAAGGGNAGLTAAQNVVENLRSAQPVGSLPPQIAASIPEESRAAAEEAFQLAGGGQEGLNAAQNVVTGRQEQAASQESANKARGVQLQAIKLASSILSNPETKDVVGAVQSKVNNYFDPENARAVADIEELADILTTENLDLMTGVLSESDIKLLRSVAGGGLDRRRDDKTFMRRVGDIVFSLANSQNFTPEDLSTFTDDELKAYRNVLAARK